MDGRPRRAVSHSLMHSDIHVLKSMKRSLWTDQGVFRDAMRASCEGNIAELLKKGLQSVRINEGCYAIFHPDQSPLP